MGNPLSYKGSTLSWEKGRRLTSLRTSGNKAVSYTYDGTGVRRSKNVESSIPAEVGTTDYVYEDGNLLRQTRESEVIDFLYGGEGILGIVVNGAKYIFRKNGQGDVTHIYNASGALVGKYSYNAYGECKIERNVGEIAETNPIRYRGYYYDKETGLYYLKTRYYDPETGRFLNQDDISYLDPETINGLNLYAYCHNNPVM